MKFDESGWIQGEGVELDPTLSFQNAHNARTIIVMHYTAGYTAASAVTTFKNQTPPRSSAHFVIDVDGTIIQMVSCDQVAWHAGGGLYNGMDKPNEFSIGIEIVNPGYHWPDGKGGYVNWKRQPVSPDKLAPFPGFTESHDLWVGSTAFWPNFPPVQLDGVEALTRALLAAYSSLADIVGHRDIDTVRRLKVDPGPAFPMARYRALLDNRRGDHQRMGIMKVAVPVLNVRGGPGTAFEKMDWGPLRTDEQVEMVAFRDGWASISRGVGDPPDRGWVFAAYLRPG